jgi:hypothetical protein
MMIAYFASFDVARLDNNTNKSLVKHKARQTTDARISITRKTVSIS